MEQFGNTIVEFWNTYWPIIVGFATAIGTTALGAWAIYTQFIKPIVDKVRAMKQSFDEKRETLSPLELITANTQVTDLKAKLENPTIPDSLKLQYQEQLFALESLISKTNSTLDKVNDTTSSF